jgi:hypothetical protein
MQILGSVISLYRQTPHFRNSFHVGVAHRWDTPLTDCVNDDDLELTSAGRAALGLPVYPSVSFAHLFASADTEPIQPVADQDVASD